MIFVYLTCPVLSEIVKDLNLTGSIFSEVLVHAELGLLEVNVVIYALRGCGMSQEPLFFEQDSL